MAITQQLGDDNSVAVTKTPFPFSPNIRSEPIESLGKGAVTFFLEGGGRRKKRDSKSTHFESSIKWRQDLNIL